MVLALLMILGPADVEPAGDLGAAVPQPVVALPAPVGLLALLPHAASLVPITASSTKFRDKWIH